MGKTAGAAILQEQGTTAIAQAGDEGSLNQGGGMGGGQKWAESRAVSETELKDNPKVSSLGPSVAIPQLSWEQTPVLCKQVSFPVSVFIFISL